MMPETPAQPGEITRTDSVVRDARGRPQRHWVAAAGTLAEQRHVLHELTFSGGWEGGDILADDMASARVDPAVNGREAERCSDESRDC